MCDLSHSIRKFTLRYGRKRTGKLKTNGSNLHENLFMSNLNHSQINQFNQLSNMCIVLSLVVSIGLQYLACQSAAIDTDNNSYLWDQYSLVFESQLQAVFHSSVALQQAHIFAQKHRLIHRSALSYACSDYKSGQMIGELLSHHQIIALMVCHQG